MLKKFNFCASIGFSYMLINLVHTILLKTGVVTNKMISEHPIISATLFLLSLILLSVCIYKVLSNSPRNLRCIPPVLYSEESNNISTYLLNRILSDALSEAIISRFSYLFSAFIGALIFVGVIILAVIAVIALFTSIV